MEKQTVNILGTKYTVEDDDSLAKSNLDGLHEAYTKRISVRNVNDMLTDADSEEIKKARYAETLRHELTHAFFTESGLEDYCENEQLVNWFAIQSPKIFKVFQELDIL
ncbi:MAG: hypothetical protein ACLRZ9_05830 [Eubacterium sp.]